jgi:hypothetical protein
MEELEDWPKLKELCALLESGESSKVRRLLRAHEETGFSEEDREETRFRIALDAELERITHDEFRAQCGLARLGNPEPYFSELVKHSPPFVQYLNVYLYFNARFAAGRILDVCAQNETSDSDCNQPIPALPSPPMGQKGWDNEGAAEEFLELIRTKNRTPDAKNFLRFLDGFPVIGGQSKSRDVSESEEIQFELWLRRLYFNQEHSSSFEALADAMLKWSRSRYSFYVNLERRSQTKTKWVDEWEKKTSSVWKEGLWTANNPIAARCALVDFYWLAKILRADVSPNGEVTYRNQSWLYLLAMRKATPPQRNGNESSPAAEAQLNDQEMIDPQAEALRIEEVLRVAFGYACDVVQNAVEIADDCADWNANPEDYAVPPPGITDPTPRPHSAHLKTWREVEDSEHIEVAVHRRERDHQTVPGGELLDDTRCSCKKVPGWSRRVWNGEQLDHTIGLAFSGGGIRSATFNLGVLQKLQELDLLRQVDYLSTVSGGGYIGAWLVGNVRRTRYWLSRMTDWDASIDHLRRYSNYLAPHTGILSADTWSVGLTWVRNAFLIQLTAFVWLASLLLLTLDLKKLLFEWAQSNAEFLSGPLWSLVGSMALIAISILFFLSHERQPAGGVARSIFVNGKVVTILTASLAWFACFLTAGLLWGQATHNPTSFQKFSNIFNYSYQNWSGWVILVFCVAIFTMAGFSVGKTWVGKITGVIFPAILVPLLAYLALCGELRIFGVWLSGNDPKSNHLDWMAFTAAPFLTMVGMAIAISVFIGLVGRSAPDWTREWWTRYGSWIAMLGTIALVVMAAAVVAPWAVLELPKLKWPTIKWGAVLAWVGSTIGGLLAGNSSRTGASGKRSKALELVARIGGFVFIVGAVALSSTVVYLILREALVDDAKGYADNLDKITGAQSFAHVPWMWIFPVLTIIVGWLFSKRFDLNTFSLNQFYRNRLVRCYLGATRWQAGKRQEHPFTGFDQRDEILMSDLRVVPTSIAQKQFCGEIFRGPFPILNCSLNLGGSSDLSVHTRQSASFTVTPLFSGASRKKVGYAPIAPDGNQDCFAAGITLGEAISVSGAAASPNMGYNTSPLVSFLMTLFNVRLGWWFPNPAQSAWNQDRPPSASCLGSELLGLANENRDFVNVSDGGHFENLGVYELIRRKTRVIIASDAECDEMLTFGSLGNLVRIVETDFGAKIDLDLSSIQKDEKTGQSKAHSAVGKITYSNGTYGYLIYLKSSITGDEDIGVAQYRSGHPAFPHEGTGNQFYSEDQFEAYRRLGYHIADRAFRDAEDRDTPLEIAAKLYDVWAPASFNTNSFLQHAVALERILEHLSADDESKALFSELTEGSLAGVSLTTAQDAACMEVIQLMENVFLDLRLDDFWKHPDNRGWMTLFSGFARSPLFRESWSRHRNTYGIRFEYFCSQRLGLERDRPTVRV